MESCDEGIKKKIIQKGERERERETSTEEGKLLSVQERGPSSKNTRKKLRLVEIRRGYIKGCPHSLSFCR